MLQPGDQPPEVLFWVGCAGAFDERAQQTTQSIARLLAAAGVDYAILGPRERCTGDPARRMGHEYLFQMLAEANVETLNGAGVTKIVASCAHCFNTLANEYPDYGGTYEVVHHTELLSALVAEGRLAPKPAGDGGSSRTTTRATSAGTTGASTLRATWSAPPAPQRSRCLGTASAPSAAAPAAPDVDGGDRGNAASTTRASRRRRRRAPTRSRRRVRTAS